MFDWMLPAKHAIAIIKKDHDTVKDLFDKFEKAKSADEKETIIGKAIEELKIHAAIEEEIFYPAVRRHVGADLMNEADEEHHVARVLIAELDSSGRGNDHRDAKFKVLSESVRHHIKDEEDEVLPKAKEVHMDFETLGEKMLARKQELKQRGIPEDAEHVMVANAGGKGDSPAAKAHATKPASRSPKEETMATKSSKSSTKSSKSSTKSSKKRASSSKSSKKRSGSTTSPKAKRKIEKVMKEHKSGTLKSGSGKKVTSRKQAVAIALSEARKSGAKAPRKKKAA
jgi:hypothetical protein